MAEGQKLILCVGALTLDTIFRMDVLPDGPGKFLPLDAVEVAAGMASSAATAIARLGGNVALWASVGSDGNGQRLVTEITAEGERLFCCSGSGGRALGLCHHSRGRAGRAHHCAAL